MKVRTPAYRLHKGGGQALMAINGRRIYRRTVAEWLAADLTTPPPAVPTKPEAPPDQPPIAEIAAAYKRHCEGYYKIGYVGHCRAAMLALDELYGDTDAAAFGTVQFDAVIAALVAKVRC